MIKPWCMVFAALMTVSMAMLVGCDAAVDDQVRSRSTDNQILAETVAAVNADGTGAQLATLSGQLKIDPDCTKPSLSLYDAGRRSRLCIGSSIAYNQTETLDLRTIRYGRCQAIDVNGRCTLFDSWAGKVEYVQPGFNAGDIRRGAAAHHFNAWGPLQRISPNISEVVTLYGPRL